MLARASDKALGAGGVAAPIGVLDAVAIEQQLIARLELHGRETERSIKNAHETSVHIEQLRLRAGLTRDANRMGVSRASVLHPSGAEIEQAIHHGDERRFGKLLFNQVAIEKFKNFVGRHQTVAATG